MSSDLVNGLFEFAGGLMLVWNIRRLYLDKEVKGASMLPLAFFTSWGLWNCWFYPTNGLWYSFLGGVFLAVVNAIWLGQMFYYIKVRPWRGVMDELEKWK